MRRSLLFLWGVLALCVLSSCGGGQRSGETGRAMVRVDWPASTRLVPFASSSIRVLVTLGGRGVGEAVLERPAGGGVATATFERLPIGEVTVNATAHPSTGAGGVAQAIASGTATIQSGQTANLDLVMASTITQASVLPVASTLPVNGDVSLVPSFRNAQGQPVFVALATQRWSSRNTGIATVDAAGRVVAVSAGTVIIDVTDTESNLTGSATITVQGTGGGGGSNSPITPNPANGHYYQVVAAPTGITWADAKTAAETRGGYLATVTNPDENTFVVGLTNQSDFWKYDGQSELGPWLGGFRDGTTWKWVTGETWSFTKWSFNQPDSNNDTENRLHYFAATWKGETRDGRWNDIAPTGISSTVPDKRVIAYVIEWNSNPSGGGGGGGGTSMDPSSGLQPPVFNGPVSGTVPTFATPTYYTHNQFLGESRVADFDQDNKLDIVVTGHTELLVLYGKGDGTFENPVSIMSKVDTFEATQVADMNNDGKTDIIVTDRLDKIHVLVNQGARQFATSKFVGGIRPRDMTIGDFNGDGNKDIAVDNNYDLTLFLGDGTGGLTRGSSTRGGGTLDGVACADFNKDGKLDVIATHNTSTVGQSGIQLFAGRGDGTFTHAGSSTAGTWTGLHTFAIDANRDGTWDAGVSMFQDHNLAIFLGLGTGAFQQRTLYSQPSSWKCATADLNNDGYWEVISANSGGARTFSVFRNLGNGLFADRVSYPADGQNALYISPGDFNRDGKIDIAVVLADDKKVAVHLNTTP